MRQRHTWPKGFHGARGDEIVNGHSLAIDALGPIADTDKNSGLTAFAYLFRRFGPPWLGSDDHKDLACYLLTTKRKDVLLWMCPSGMQVAYAVGYIADKHFREEWSRPFTEWENRAYEWFLSQHPGVYENDDSASEAYWKARIDKENDFNQRACDVIGEYPGRARYDDWRSGPQIMVDVNQALFDALQELLRPVYIRDVPINVFGRMSDDEAHKWDKSAARSKFSGYGIPKEAMTELLAESLR